MTINKYIKILIIIMALEFNNVFATYNQVSPPDNIESIQRLSDYLNIEEDLFVPDTNFNQTEDSITTEQIPEQQEEIQIKTNSPKKSTLKGSAEFEKAFNEALKIDPSISKYKNFLIKTAKRESGFNSYIQNTAGAPYYGYFQMGKEEIKRTTGMTVEQFRKNPVAQILGAAKLYELNLRTIKAIGVYEIGKNAGYTDDALVAGAWAGGPGGVKKFLLGKGDPSDSHWYGGNGGTSVGKIMNSFK